MRSSDARTDAMDALSQAANHLANLDPLNMNWTAERTARLDAIRKAARALVIAELENLISVSMRSTARRLRSRIAELEEGVTP